MSAWVFYILDLNTIIAIITAIYTKNIIDTIVDKLLLQFYNSVTYVVDQPRTRREQLELACEKIPQCT